MKKILFIIIFLSLMALVLTGLVIVLKGLPKSKLKTEGRPQVMIKESAEQEAGTILVVAEIIPATAAGSSAYVKLTVKPQSKDITLSAFDLRLLIKVARGAAKSGGTIAIDKDLIKSDWSFPIKRVKVEGEQLSVEISGLHISQQVFNLQEEQTLATIPIIVPLDEEIKIELDNKVTQFLDGKSLKLITAHEQK